MFYKTLHEKFLKLVKDHQLLDKEIIIKTRILKTTEAIGNPDRRDFPLLKGKEVLMEALFLDKNGQAYTDAPSEFKGLLKDVFGLSLDNSRNRALFIAALNAVMRYLFPSLTTIHCKNNEPEECAQKIAEFVKSLRVNSVGLIGLQPAILDCLVKMFGNGNVFCIDRDEDNRNKVKYGVFIRWGDMQGMKDIFKNSELVLATGSTVVNGSVVNILDFAQVYNRPVYFYGTTIAGVAQLMDLNRLCFKSS